MDRTIQTKNSRRSALLAIFLSAFLMAVASGCSGAVSSGNAYASEFRDALKQTNSEYVRGILEDGDISTSEYRDAHQQKIKCMKDAGYAISYSDFGGVGYEQMQTTGLDTPEAMQAELKCDLEWVGPIDALFEDIAVNPDNVDLDDLTARCLVRKGLAPEGFRGVDYRELRASSSSGLVSVEVTDQDGIESFEPDSGDTATSMVLPGGTSMDHPEALMCIMNPTK